MNQCFQKNNEKLVETKYFEISSSHIKPNGWLTKQLEIQKDGLTGNIEDVWVDLSEHSAWLHGTGENWERGPYYLDGLIPLAYLLDDNELKEKVEKWVWSIYSTQLENGWFGPEDNNDWWPRMVVLKCFQQYYEYTNNKLILEFIAKYLRYMHKHIDERPFANWGKSRVADNVYVVTWLYNITKEDWLYELGSGILGLGFNWTKYFNNIPYTNPTSFYYEWDKVKNGFSWDTYDLMGEFSTHTVNIAMGIKYPYFDYIYNNNNQALSDLSAGIKDLMKYHGQPYGIWSGDEHLNSNNPSSGSELCSINEYLFSIEKILREEKLSYMGDVAENLMYNAFFATNDYAMKTHQYVQQANQVVIKYGEKPWYNNGEEANIFGLEPEFGCCAANMHQGLPKFVQHLWYGQSNGLYKAMYGPSIIETTINDNIVKITEGTNYPFNDEIKYTIETDSEFEFLIDFRVPKWSTDGIQINGELYTGDIVSYNVNTAKTKEIILKFTNMKISANEGANKSIYYTYGPILLSLNVYEQWDVKRFKNRGEYANYEIHPTSSWNYAINADSLSFESCNEEISFGTKGLPLKIKAKARKIKWELEKNVASIPPAKLEYLSEEENIELVAYGSTKLRVTCFPWYK